MHSAQPFVGLPEAPMRQGLASASPLSSNFRSGSEQSSANMTRLPPRQHPLRADSSVFWMSLRSWPVSGWEKELSVTSPCLAGVGHAPALDGSGLSSAVALWVEPCAQGPPRRTMSGGPFRRSSTRPVLFIAARPQRFKGCFGLAAAFRAQFQRLLMATTPLSSPTGCPTPSESVLL